MHRPSRWGSLIVAGGLGWGASSKAAPPARPIPPLPTKSLPVDSTWREPLGGGGVRTVRRGLVPVERSFGAAGITKVVLRAVEAERAEITTGAAGSPILVSGLPEGNEVGYHPADPNAERVASPYGGGLDFDAEVSGTTLVVSAIREARFIHHEHLLVQLRVTVPPGVRVVREARPIAAELQTETTHRAVP